MAYLSLYRKWRPSSFADVVGQKHVVSALANSLDSGKVSHAYLFSGPRGTGKTTMARLFSAGINCAEGVSSQPCGQCSECQSIPKGSSINMVEIDGASNRGINEIRQLREGIHYTPTNARYRVYIIDEVHMLTTEAFNALLKTLEEPPPHVVFIFATTELHKVPPTILSRCQRYDFRRLEVEDIVARLKVVAEGEGVDVQSQALQMMAVRADGGVRDALGILEQCIAFGGRVTSERVGEMLGIAGQESIIEFMQAVREKQVGQALTLVHSLYAGGRDLSQFVKDVLMFLHGQLTTENLERQQMQVIAREMEEIAACERDMRYAVDIRIPVEVAVIRLVEEPRHETDSVAVQKLEQKIKQLERRLSQIAAQSKQESEVPSTDAGPCLTSQAGDEEKLETIRKTWQDFLELLHKEKYVQAEAFLREGVPTRLEGDSLTITFASERGFHKTCMEQTKNREPAERLLSRFYGRELRLRCALQEQRDRSPEPAEPKNPIEEDELDDSVKAAFRLFGGKLLGVDTDPKG